MGVNDKLDAALHPGGSGVDAVLRATDTADAAARRAQNLQAAISDLRILHNAGNVTGWGNHRCKSCGFIWPCPTINVIDSHHV